MLRVLVVGVLVAAAAVAVVVLTSGDDGPGPIKPAEDFAAAWTRGSDAAAARLTDAPRQARAALAATRTGLDGGTVRAGVTGVTEDGDRAEATLGVRWQVPRFGVFAYETTLHLREADDVWTIDWRPDAVHPKLTSGTRLGTLFTAPVRAPILDRRGRELVGRPGFAYAVLGTVGPITAEQLEETDRPLTPSSQVGQSGLAAAYDERLGGSPSRSIVIRDRLDDAIEELAIKGGTTPRPLRTTLDRRLQAAAERALDGVGANAALVALEASTGNVLAVANRPRDSQFNRAFDGRYPPGSTFKVVVTSALLRGGLDVNRTVNCPPRIVVQNRPFRNFEGGAAGAVPFRTDFAQSCNTAFVSLAGRMQYDTLTQEGRRFGLGRPLEPGLSAAAASVPPADSDSALAAMMIGQDRIVASPLSMAGVAATVAAGRWHAPRLVATAPRVAGPRVPVGQLRSLMRLVVTGGTGTALAGVPGAPAGKSGTAEYGSGDPLPTHAWFIAYRDDLAVAVIVEGGSAGGRVAAPIVAGFLSAV